MLSVTDLSMYEYCRRKLYLVKVFGLKEVPKDVAVRGKIIHEFYKRINDAEKKIVLDIDSAEKSAIKAAYSEEYDTILSELVNEKKAMLEKSGVDVKELAESIMKNTAHEVEMRADNLFDNIRQHNLFGAELWKVLTPKIRSEELISSKELDLIGKVDMIKEYKYESIPIEMKTGKAPEEGAWPSHKLQLASYMNILSDQGRQVKRGIVRYIDHDTDRVILMNPFLKEEIRKNISGIHALLAGKIPTYTDNKNKCKACNLKDVCYDKDKIENLSNLLKKG